MESPPGRDTSADRALGTSLPPILEKHIAALNAGDLDALAATFADDAYVTAQ
jgi:hypothetical protein